MNSELTYVVLGQKENGKLVLLKEVNVQLVEHREIKTLIEGNNLIINEDENGKVS